MCISGTWRPMVNEGRVKGGSVLELPLPEEYYARMITLLAHALTTNIQWM